VDGGQNLHVNQTRHHTGFAKRSFVCNIPPFIGALGEYDKDLGRMETKLSIKALAWLLYLVFLIAAIEAAAFAAGTSLDMFSYRSSYISKLKSEHFSYEHFKQSRQFSAITGWQAPPNKSRRSRRNCLDQTFIEDTLDDGRRQSLADEADTPAQLAIFGDSYVYGDEISNGETISSQLYSRYAIPAINYGVNGFGPVQALLRAKEKLEAQPGVKMVVLGIMFENIRRMVNRYKPVYFRQTGIESSPKPFIEDGRIVPLPVIEHDKQFFRYINEAFKVDYWERPEREFPYTIALFKAVQSEFVKRKATSKLHGLLGSPEPRYHYDYYDAYMTTNLAALIKDFDRWAKKSNKTGLVLFIPQNLHDLSSPAHFMKTISESVTVDIRVVEGTQAEWEKYNLKPDGGCHPSSFGVAMIAGEIARWVQERTTVQR